MSDDEKVYEASTGEAEPEVQGDEPWDWVSQLDELLVWLQQRWLPLAAMVLFSSVLLFQSYVNRTGMLVSLSGSEALALLPIVFSMAVFAVLAFAFFVGLPAIMLMTRINGTTDSLMMGIVKLEKGSKERISASNKMFVGWFCVWGGLWLLYLLSLFLMSESQIQWWGTAYVLLLMLVVAATIASISYVYYVRVDEGRRIGFDLLWAVFLGSTSQVVLISFSLKWMLEANITEYLSAMNAAIIMIIMFSVFILVSLIPLLMAFFFVRLRRQYNLFKGAVIVALCLLTAVSLWPAAGGFLMTKTSVGAMLGGRECVQLLWRGGVENRHAGLIADSQSDASKRVRVVADIGGTLQVTVIGEKKQAIYLVPVSELAAVESCQPSDDEA